jgi:hypothetical protein
VAKVGDICCSRAESSARRRSPRQGAVQQLRRRQRHLAAIFFISKANTEIGGKRAPGTSTVEGAASCWSLGLCGYLGAALEPKAPWAEILGARTLRAGRLELGAPRTALMELRASPAELLQLTRWSPNPESRDASAIQRRFSSNMRRQRHLASTFLKSKMLAPPSGDFLQF